MAESKNKVYELGEYISVGVRGFCDISVMIDNVSYTEVNLENYLLLKCDVKNLSEEIDSLIFYFYCAEDELGEIYYDFIEYDKNIIGIKIDKDVRVKLIFVKNAVSPQII